MASTSVHFPKGMEKRLDELARRRGVSRNRLIVMALEQLLESELGDWPEGYFALDRLSVEEREILERSEEEFIGFIESSRNSSTEPVL
ncbi:MAG: ribbon-helix-helix protein, CopG family [Deltaproteobacteria bacterium]|nr:ribbon-helix-helix protein, CopG family [Deltaproteobacteria bacterium]